MRHISDLTNRCRCLQTAKGDISLWSLALWWPYHFGLRTKLKIQRHTRTEPTWSSIAPGWCAVVAGIQVVTALVLAGCAPCCVMAGSELSNATARRIGKTQALRQVARWMVLH